MQNTQGGRGEASALSTAVNGLGVAETERRSMERAKVESFRSMLSRGDRGKEWSGGEVYV
jgi:hypothetical protein